MPDRGLIKKNEIIFVFLLIVFTVIFRAQSIDVPFDRNEGAFAYEAAQVSQGAVLYKDIFEHRPPIIVYIYKTAFSLFGQSQESVRYFTTLYITACILIIYILARVIWRSAFISMLSVFFYVIYQHSLVFQGFSADTAVYAQLPVVLSLFFLSSRDKDYEEVNLCLSGFFAAVAFFTHLMAFFFVFVPAIYILLYTEKNKLRNLGWFLCGYAFLFTAVTGWAIFNGNLKDMYAGLVTYNLAVSKIGPVNLPAIFAGLKAFMSVNILPCIAAAYSAWIIFKRKQDGNNFLLAGSIAALFLGIALAKSEFYNYYLILAPFGAVLSAVMISDMYEFMCSDIEIKKYAWMILLMLMVLNTAIVSKANEIGVFLRRNMYTQAVRYEEKATAREVISKSGGKISKDNYIFAWPDMPGIYFYTKAKAASKYTSAYPLDVFKDDKSKTLDTLFYGRPSWVVLKKGTYQAYQAFLDNYYAKEGETENLALYRSLLY